MPLNNKIDFKTFSDEKRLKKKKIPLTTPMESVFFWSASACALYFIFGLLYFFQTGLQAGKLFSLALAASGLAVFVQLYRNTNNFYILDSSGRRILYHCKFFNDKRITELISFSEIAAVTVAGKLIGSRRPATWEYQAVILSKNGKVLVMNDASVDGFSKSLKLAERLASISGAMLVEPTPEKYADPCLNSDGSYTFVHTSHDFIRSCRSFFSMIGIAIVGFMVILAVIFISGSLFVGSQ